MKKYIRKRERAWRARWSADLDAPGARRAAALDMNLFDHGFLRRYWTNVREISPGVFRSNQPSPRQLAEWAGRGVRTVLNFRGPSDWGSYLLEKETCEALGLTLIDHRLYSASPPLREAVLGLEEIFARAEYPLLMHCKSGADRAGLGAALYLLLHEGADLERARKELSFRHLHIRAAKTGMLDHFLDCYGAARDATGIGFADWVRDEYDRDAVEASFTPPKLGNFIVSHVLRRE